MGTRVRILERFEVTTRLGSLVVTEPRTGREDVIDGPRERTLVYIKDECPMFSTKKAALVFIKKHPGKVELA